MNRHNGTNPDLESAIQNVLCAAELTAGPIEAALTGETACYAFYKLLEEIDALRSTAARAICFSLSFWLILFTLHLEVLTKL